MPKVISNSSPLIHLAKIKQLNLLRKFFKTVIIPEAVYKESIIEGKKREEVNVLKQSEWISVIKVKEEKLVKLLRANLDLGEAEAITIALESDADLILLDDSDAREKARLFELTITGTIGILLRAKREGVIVSLKDELIKLKASGFWIDDELQKKILSEVGE